MNPKHRRLNYNLVFLVLRCRQKQLIKYSGICFGALWYRVLYCTNTIGREIIRPAVVRCVLLFLPQHTHCLLLRLLFLQIMRCPYALSFANMRFVESTSKPKRRMCDAFRWHSLQIAVFIDSYCTYFNNFFWYEPQART